MKFGNLQVRIGLLALSFLSLIWGFWTLLSVNAPRVFTSQLEDMSYGWYVPVFSLYVLWTERRQLCEAVVSGSPSWGGLLATLPFLGVGFLGVRGSQLRFEIVAFAGLLVTISWAMFGRKMAKRMLFPAAFLLFCIPLATFLDIVTVHLRLLATSVAYVVMKGFGVDVIRQGTALSAADGSFAIDVAEPCSGLRSIFALMALTAGYAYFTQKTWLRRGILFSLSVPLAVLGNVMRILSICIVANYASGEFALGFYHDYSGYVVFIVAISLMVACGELITRLSGLFGGRCADSPQAGGEPVVQPQPTPLGFGQLTVPAVTAVLTVAVMSLLAMTPETTLCEPPDVALGELAGFESRKLEPSEAELTVLPPDTRFDKRLYTAPDGHWHQVAMVIGGASKSSIHRPELCLPAQGFLMTNPRSMNVLGTDWRVLTLDGGGAGRPSIGFAYTFFNQDGFRTSSHVVRIFRDVWDRSVHNRIDRWVMVTVNSSRWDDSGLSAFLARLKGALK